MIQTQLRKYQRIDLEKIKNKFNGRCLVSWEMGLGKSLLSLKYAEETDSWPCVIVCPAFLKPNWVNEVRKHLNMRAEVIQGRKVRGAGLIKPNNKIFIINYDILWYWRWWIIRLKPKLIVLDEGRFIKTPDSQRTRAARRIVKKSGAKSLLVLDGTPIRNRPVELYPIVSLLNPRKFNSFMEYADEFCNPRYTNWGWVFDGATKLGKLNRLLRNTVMIRRLKSKVLKELPPKQHIVVPLDIVKRREYDKELADVRNWLRQSHLQFKRPSKVEERGKYMQLLQKTAMLKLPAIMEWIDNYLDKTDEKLLIFGIHRKVLETLHAKYDNSVLLYGSTSQKDRQRVVYDFERNKHTRLLFGNMTVAGAGWSCKATSTVVTIELPWSPADLDQLTDRVHGIERGVEGKQVTCYYLVAEDTVEENLMTMLDRKEAIIDQVMDAKAADTSINIHDQFTKLVMNKGRLVA